VPKLIKLIIQKDELHSIIFKIQDGSYYSTDCFVVVNIAAILMNNTPAIYGLFLLLPGNSFILKN